MRASCIQECLHWVSASGIVSHFLCRVLCSGHEQSSSLTSKGNMAALQDPSGQNSSFRVLLLK